MIQPHPQEEGWESKRFREAEEKKLFALHCENERLVAQQYEFQGVIADYAHKIDTFGEKTKQLQEENRELRAEGQKMSSKMAKVEEALNRRNEQYCSLYNYLFTEKRGTIQDAFIKEIDLSNRLNQIQHESDVQIINKLKDNIKKKNEELLRQSQRITELEGSLITSSYEYQEKINHLKNQNQILQRRPSVPNYTLPTIQGALEYCLTTKIEGLQKEARLYEQQLNMNRKELSTLKKVHSSLQRQKLLLESELNALKAHLSTFDGSIYSILLENNSLKGRLESEILRNQQLQRHYPEFANRPDELNNFLDVKEVEAKLNQKISSLNDQLQSLKKQVQALTSQSKASLEGQLDAEKKYESLKIVSTSAFQKLKDVIATYVPYYFRKGGLDNYNLDKEEQQFISQKNVEKTLRTAYQEINQKAVEAHQYKLKLIEAEQKIKKQDQQIRLLEKQMARKEENLIKLSEAVKALTEARKNHDCTHNNRYGFEAYEEDEDLDQMPNDEEYISRIPPESESLEKGYQLKIQILQKAIQDLQADRSQFINLIKTKEALMAQMAAELKALSSISHIKQIRIQPATFSEVKPTFSECFQQESIEDEGQYLGRKQLDEIREQLRQLSSQYKLQKQLLLKEFDQKEAQSHSKYLNLLKQYNELNSKYITLESSNNNHQVPQVNNEDQNQSVHSELPLQPIEAHHQPQKDQPTISETAIETFTDTLKKYEKEFNRFVSIYEAQIKKSMESSMISEMAHESEGESQMPPDDHLESLQTMLGQHHETIKHLESLLEQKDRQTQLQVGQLENELREQRLSTAAIKKRLEDAETTIFELKQQVLSSKSGAEFTSSESANTAFLILNAKNRQIEQLKLALQKLRKSSQEKSREQSKLGELKEGHSQIEAEEYRIFREIMEQQNLVGVLQAVARRLA